MKKLLVIDDEVSTLEVLVDCFYNLYEVVTSENALKGLNLLTRHRVDAIILDLFMPRFGGLEFLKEVRRMYPDVPVLVITASGDDEATREAFDLGAVGLVRKPFNIPELRTLVAQAIAASESSKRQDLLEKTFTRDLSAIVPIGQSGVFRRTLESIRSLAEEHVLLTGERGVGKRFLARQIHAWSRRAREPVLSVGCAELPPLFLQLELFGRWCPTAEQSTRGVIDLASSGTLVLENISRIPHDVQHALVRLMKHREFLRVGSQQIIRAEVTIVATLERPLSEAVASKSLIPELAEAFSLSVVSIPPLRERRDDVLLLAHHFLHQFRETMETETLDIASGALQKMREYSWPGNVAELRSVIERALVLYGSSKQITYAELPHEINQLEPSEQSEIDFDGRVSAYEKKLIAEAFERCDGTVKAAAKILGISARKLQLRVDRLNVRLPAYKKNS